MFWLNAKSRMKAKREITPAGFAPSGKRSNVCWGVLPALALCFSTVGWSQVARGFPGHHHPQLQLPAAVPLANLAAADAQAGASYRFVTINVPGTTNAGASSINDDGLVTGNYADSDSNERGFVWKDGVLRKVEYPGALYTYLWAVNNHGVAIAYYGDGTTNHTVLYSVESGTWTPLPDIPGYSDNEGYGLNDDGFAVGNAYEINTTVYPSVTTSVAWIWNPNTRMYSFFAVPGSAQYSTAPNGINNKGQVAGWYADSSGIYHGYIKEYGTYTTIDFPGASYTFPDGLSNTGVLQGQILTAAPTYAAEGFTGTSGGVFAVVDYPGPFMTSLVGINDQGDVCGEYWEDANPNVGFAFVAFRTGPGPEP